MIKVEKYNEEIGTPILLRFQNGNNLSINFLEDFDLSFLPETKSDSASCMFEIDVDDIDLHSIFFELYSRISTYKPEGKKERKFKRQDRKRTHPLVSNGIIEWLSDGEKNANKMYLYLQGRKIVLFFERVLEDGSRAVKVKTRNSSYGNFNIPFIYMYGRLCDTDFEKKQNNEYLLSLKI